MKLLPVLANLNTGYKKVAAPSNGVAAFFFSTNLDMLRHESSLFSYVAVEEPKLKKAMRMIGYGVPSLSKNVER